MNRQWIHAHDHIQLCHKDRFRRNEVFLAKTNFLTSFLRFECFSHGEIDLSRNGGPGKDRYSGTKIWKHSQRFIINSFRKDLSQMIRSYQLYYSVFWNDLFLVKIDSRKQRGPSCQFRRIELEYCKKRGALPWFNSKFYRSRGFQHIFKDRKNGSEMINSGEFFFYLRPVKIFLLFGMYGSCHDIFSENFPDAFDLHTQTGAGMPAV